MKRAKHFENKVFVKLIFAKKTLKCQMGKGKYWVGGKVMWKEEKKKARKNKSC